VHAEAACAPRDRLPDAPEAGDAQRASGQIAAQEPIISQPPKRPSRT